LSQVETFSSGESLLVETGVALSTGGRLEECVYGAWESEEEFEETSTKPPALPKTDKRAPSTVLSSPLFKLPPLPEVEDLEGETVDAIFGDDPKVGCEALDCLFKSVDKHLDKQHCCLRDLQQKYGIVNQWIEELEKVPAQIPAFASRIGAAEAAALEASRELGTLADIACEVKKMQWKFEQPTGKVRALTSVIKMLKGHVDDSGIECHQIHFSSKQDFMVWCSDRPVSISCFCDAMALMNAIGPAVVLQE